ncbi:DUF1697 domain-containing protein [Lactococcus piscium]|uniref:DUF1697 domain-containing protein n=1 Tax=Pseudolactococcus carnosus TaxID=2749961 RepID=UPI001FBBF77F|nr:DUF1697 domain-containing protein [Lactococcus carnosus]MCJ1995620.1 DUF1697 domain-containing protein [Lactococcus carnosus]
MKRYIALLRGINIGGKNKLAMADLKTASTELGLLSVKTYINSGNLIFTSPIDDQHLLQTMIETMIKETFDLAIPVHLILQTDLKMILNNAPDWWGTDDQAIYDNLIFILSPLSTQTVYDALGPPNTSYEKESPDDKAIFWSFIRKAYRQTNWWAKTAKSTVSTNLTIRTANTVKKIVDM